MNNNFNLLFERDSETGIEDFPEPVRKKYCPLKLTLFERNEYGEPDESSLFFEKVMASEITNRFFERIMILSPHKK